MSPKKVELIIGPCAVESYEQMEKIGKILSFYQIRYLRAGAYKPRTSPKSFQGMGKEGIEIIHEVAQKYNLLSVSEIMDVRDIDFMKDKIDILQVGSRNMYNYTLLKELGKVDNTILLKRGLSATFEEFIEASEYINVNGNNNIWLCERGIRTMEGATRNTLDLSCVALLKQVISYPVVVDLSHSLGRKDIILPMACAAIAAGADELMVEVHPTPEKAISDSQQQLSITEFCQLYEKLEEEKYL